MSRRKKRNRRAPQTIPLIHVYDEQALFALKYQVARLAFESADAIVSRDGKPSVALKVGATVIAGVVCENERLRWSAEQICEAVLIYREDKKESEEAA